jgi:GTP-binding protein EngB required for normal cell division
MMQTEAILELVSSLANEWNLANLRPQIVACKSLMQARNAIEVVVFGRFKAGKSSFLNHLVGRDVLPIGVLPLTAVITRLHYGPVERAEVRFLDGAAKGIPVEEIGRYVGENENPDNQKQVASVEVELPALKPLAPLQFVDTPGLDSVFTHNTEVALNWLPNVGAALVAISSDAPLSERDLALLDELRRYTPKIVLLLTKADLLTEPQRAEVLAFVRAQCQRKWNAGLPVFFYSIQPALAELKSELSGRLLTPLLRNRSEAAGQILRHKLASLTAQTLDYLRVALAAATQAESARTALREKLADERRQFDLFREELQVLAYEWSAKALNWSLAQLQPTQEALQLKITDDLRGQFPRWQLRLPALLKMWREWLGIFLKRELSVVSRERQTMFREPLQRARQHLTRTLRAFQDRLAGHVKTALGVSLTSREFNLEVREPPAPPVDVGHVDAAFSLVSQVIPMTLFRRPIERVLLRTARWEVEKNLSRLAADWRARVAAGIHELTRQAEQQALDELAALEQTLVQTKSNASQLRDAIAGLESARAGLWSSSLPP